MITRGGDLTDTRSAATGEPQITNSSEKSHVEQSAVDVLFASAGAFSVDQLSGPEQTQLTAFRSALTVAQVADQKNAPSGACP